MSEAVVETFRAALATGELAPLEDVLAGDVRWYGDFPGGGCRTREEVLATLRRELDAGTRAAPRHGRTAGEHVVVPVDVARAGAQTTVWFMLTITDDRVVEINDYSSDEEAEHDLATRAAEPPPASPVSALVPFAHVVDLERSISFYRLLGFEVDDTYAPHGRPVWASLRSDDARLMIAGASAPIHAHEQAVLFYLYARDLAALRDHLVAHGATPGAIVDGTPGPRQEMRVTDPDGYCLMVAQIDDETIVGS